MLMQKEGRLRLAKSLSGHDKDQLYVIRNEESRTVYLVDGKIRTLDRPKKKNRKHIQVIDRLPKSVEEILATSPIGDLEIKRALKLYQKEL